MMGCSVFRDFENDMVFILLWGQQSGFPIKKLEYKGSTSTELKRTVKEFSLAAGTE